MYAGDELRGGGLNAKAMKFARLVSEGWSQSEAYISCYPSTKDFEANLVHVSASKLARRPLVKEKIEELKLKRISRMAELRAKSREYVADVFMEGLDLIREGIDMARDAEDYQALVNAGGKMIASANTMGTFLGLNVQTPGGDDGVKKLEDLTDAELIRMVESKQGAEESSGRAIEEEARAA